VNDLGWNLAIDDALEDRFAHGMPRGLGTSDWELEKTNAIWTIARRSLSLAISRPLVRHSDFVIYLYLSHKFSNCSTGIPSSGNIMGIPSQMAYSIFPSSRSKPPSRAWVTGLPARLTNLLRVRATLAWETISAGAMRNGCRLSGQIKR